MKKIISTMLIIVTLISVCTFCMPTYAASSKLVAITFDDGPSGYTESLLDGLKERNAKATFFIVGNMASSRMSTVRRAVAEGHQIANHTTSHPDLAGLSSDKIKSELNGCRKYLVDAAGDQRFLLRPPYGSYNSTVRNTANVPIILWSVDTLDWKYRNSDTVYNNIINNTTDGSIVLLHDLYSTSVKGALRAIDTLKSRGYEFVTVNELFRRRGVTLENGKVYTAAYNKGFTLPAVEAPVISTKDVNGGKQVSITCTADIYYTTDGTTPTEKSKKYTGPFKLTETTKIRAVGYGSALGEETAKTVWVERTPKLTPSYANGYITLKVPEGATLYYTTDGSKPTYNSSKYTVPVKVDTTLNVLAATLGKVDSELCCTITKYGKMLIDTKASAWYYDAVSEAINKGIMNGVGEMQFDPQGSVTRAMFVTVLHRMSPDTQTEYTPCTFTDVKENNWYTKAVAWAQSEGVVNGVSETLFAPAENITREQMCSMLNRFLNLYEYTPVLNERAPFDDVDAISDWAKNDVLTLYNAGLINGMGDNTFCPKNTATRAQCAKISVDTWTLIEELKNEPIPEPPITDDSTLQPETNTPEIQ